MKVFTPPNQIFLNRKTSIFLAGTIDMGQSEDWQAKVIERLKDKDVNIYNPRRPDWDNTWRQSFKSPEFYQQVNWELDALEKADIIIMNILSDSKSPISLLELGLFAASGKLFVCCKDEFYRSGNIQIVCNKYNVPLFEDLDDLLMTLEV